MSGSVCNDTIIHHITNYFSKEVLTLFELIENIFNSLCLAFQTVVCLYLQFLTNGITNNTFTPSLDAFISEDGGIISETLYNDMNYAFRYVSLGLTLLLLVIHVTCFVFFASSELKDTLGQLALRLFLCVLAAFYLTSFLTTCMDFGRGIFNEAFSSIMETLSPTAGVYAVSNMWTEMAGNKNAFSDPALTALEVVGSANVKMLDILKFILQIIFFGIVAYNYTKLCAELVKRYVVMCLLHMCSPIASPFFVTSETQKVFISYIKMFSVEVGVVAFTQLWLNFSMYIMSTRVCSFTNMFVMIAIIQFGLQIENRLKELGLTTANMGGALLDSVAATGAMMGMMVTRAKGATGESMINLGGATGSMELVTLGSALTHKPMSVEGRARTMSESAGAQLRATFTKNSPNSNLTSSQKKVMDDAVAGNGLFRNQALQNVLKDLNSAGYKDAIQHVAGAEFSQLAKNLGDPRSTITPTSYSQNNGIGFEYKSGTNGIKRSGYISDTPKTGNGITSIPITMNNGKMAYANFEPMSMNDIHNTKVDALYNSTGEKLGGGMTSMEIDTGMKLNQFMYSGDADATHYAAVPNNTGGLDIMYNNEGINPMNLNSSETVGAVTSNGYNLKTTDYEWGNGTMSATDDIYNTLTTGSWSNLGLSDIKKQDIKYDHSSGEIHFSATDMSGTRSGYTALPSVHVQDKVNSGNTRTDKVHGTYTFVRTKK